MPAIDSRLVEQVRNGLRARADPARAPRMRAYMKSTMPYRGVASGGVKEICREAFAAHPLSSFGSWRATVLELWRRAEYREERYCAIALTGISAYRRFQVPAALPLYRELITTGAWWDYVDEVAVRRIGPLLLSHRDVLRPLLLRWSVTADMWLRRSSIICQVGARDRTDLELLYACIEPNLGDREFFIRKAIGWSLRSYAWTDPAEVASYVNRTGERLSGLSRREALKNIAG
ncbi:MAG TPA: DNA alkylation repair protein [Candidatus Solibacter sp.]|jgi:3-methyladenine DNA glycosylase AlkD|nr:DNA alkylation repair protein [Candidatus Solibacter sp.]